MRSAPPPHAKVSSSAGCAAAAAGGRLGAPVVPLLFDVHRERVTKQPSTREVVPKSQVMCTVAEDEYGMYLVAVPVLLTMSELLPHQLMLRYGLLTEATPDHLGRIIFVSHEWTAFHHPDPNRDHFRALKGLIERLLRGDEDGVQSDWKQQLAFKENVRLRAKRWKAALPHMFVWIDYCCMPQPSAGALPSTEEVRRASSLSAAAKLREMERALEKMKRRASPDVATVTEGNGLSSSDHRQNALATRNRDAERLVAALNAAVRSIPSYVERSTLLLVLVPPVKHTNRAGHVSEYRSWRERGWCRMELGCAWLARSKIHVIVAQGGRSTPYHLFPADALLLPPGLGEFTCCARGHDRGDGLGSMPCDKCKVRSVLEVMLEAKVTALHEKGRVFEARYFAAAKHWFLRGLTTGGGDDEAAHPRNAAPAERFKSRMLWRDDASESKETERTGASLVFWASLADEAGVLRALLKQGEGLGGVVLERRLEESWPMLSLFRGMAPLHAAAALAGWDVVETLLDAGANPQATDYAGNTPIHWMANSGRVESIKAWMRRFPDYNLEARERVAGHTALHYGAMFGPNKVGTLEALVEAGADPTSVSNSGTPLVGFAALNPDADADLVRAACRLHPNHDADLQRKPRTLKWALLLRSLRLAYRLGSRNDIVRFFGAQGGKGSTALHTAAINGNVSVARTLLQEYGADPSKRNAAGFSPLDVAAQQFGGGAFNDVPTELGAALGARGDDSCSHE